MADKRFLEHIEKLRTNFHYVPAPINWLLVGDLRASLQEVGTSVGRLPAANGQNPLMDPDYLRRHVTNELQFIARRALCLLDAPDFNKLLDGIVDLHTKKNAGYAGIGNADAWANFRTAEWFGVSAFTGCLIRMGDKVIRVEHLIKNPANDQVNESVKDTLHDLAVYAIIAICLFEELSDVRKSKIEV